jgi:hypothetical protein
MCENIIVVHFLHRPNEDFNYDPNQVYFLVGSCEVVAN